MMLGEPSRVLAGRSVLVVEDQYLIADEMRRMIERLGGRVLGPVPRVHAALDILKTEQVDLALLDVNLDGEEVYAVAESLRASGVPFVFITGYDPWTIDPRFSGAPHLEKPVGIPALLEALNAVKFA